MEAVTASLSLSLHSDWRREARTGDVVVARRPSSEARCGDPLPVVPACCIFLFRFVLIAVRERVRCTAKSFGRRLLWCAVRDPSRAVCYFCLPCTAYDARLSLFTVRDRRRRTTKGIYRAKSYRVPFAVRLHKKRTAKPLPCVF
jgi:hypothetical protein